MNQTAVPELLDRQVRGELGVQALVRVARRRTAEPEGR
jgi:hypothetical protein